MSTPTKEQARFDARLPKGQKQSVEKVNENIREKEQIIASERDSQIIFDAITNPKKPSKTLQNALEDYNAFASKSRK